MSAGIALHIGLNRVDPIHYQGWDGQLTACEADAKDMVALAKKQGFKSPTLLLTKAATAERRFERYLERGQDAQVRRSVLPHVLRTRRAGR